MPERSLLLAHVPGDGATPVVTLELDAVGDGRWQPVQRVELTERAHWLDLAAVHGFWIRLVADRPLRGASAVLHARAADARPATPAARFAGVGAADAPGALLHVAGDGARVLRCVVGETL
jgi:hypothetical protein